MRNNLMLRMFSTLLVLLGALSTDAATLSGTVTRSADGAPMTGVAVTASKFFFPLGGFEAQFFTQTNAQGQYQFNDLPAGSYYVDADAQGTAFVRQLYPSGYCPPASCEAWVHGAGVTRLDLAAAQQMSGIDLVLTEGGNLNGQVRRQDTQAALSNQSVVVLPLGWETQSNGSGAFQFARLPAGTWRLRAAGHDELVSTLHPNVPCEFSACADDTSVATAIVLGANVTLNGVDIEMPVGATISGVLQPLTTTAGLEVRFEMRHAPSGASVWRHQVPVGVDGSYVLPGLAPGSYQLAVVSTAFRPQAFPNLPCDGNCSTAIANGTPVTTVLGQTTGNIDFVLQTAPRIQGMVTDSSTGLPLPGVTVIAYTWGFTGIGGFGPITQGSAVSAADGSYLIAGLNPQPVKIATRNELGYRDERYSDQLCASTGCLTNEGADWPLDYDQTMTAHIGLQPGASIFGRVSFPEQAGVPLPLVDVFDLAGTRVTWATLAAGGLFQTTGIAPGPYRVRAYIYFGDGNGQVYGGMSCAGISSSSCDAGTGQILQLSAGTPVEVNIEIGSLFGNGFE